MSAIQKVAPHIEHFQEKIREAKETHHLTIDQLADRSGVPSSVVARISSGAHPDPKLINAAALCAVLGLSLDELCGLATPQPPDEALTHRVHDLEIENEHLRTVDEMRLAGIVAQKPILYGLFSYFVISIITTLALLAYLIGDAMHVDVGLIQNGVLSKPAIAAVILIVAAFGNAIIVAVRLYRHSRKG